MSSDIRWPSAPVNRTAMLSPLERRERKGNGKALSHDSGWLDRGVGVQGAWSLGPQGPLFLPGCTPDPGLVSYPLECPAPLHYAGFQRCKPAQLGEREKEKGPGGSQGYALQTVMDQVFCRNLRIDHNAHWGGSACLGYSAVCPGDGVSCRRSPREAHCPAPDISLASRPPLTPSESMGGVGGSPEFRLWIQTVSVSYCRNNTV